MWTLKHLDNSEVYCICECIHNIETISLSPGNKKKKKIHIQKGNGFLSLIVVPLISGVFGSL